VALARLAIHDRVAAAPAVSLVCGSVLPWPTWALARRAVGARWAVLPAIAVALHPELARFSALTMSESAFMLCLYGALALAAASRPLFAGLGIGAAFAVRPEALLPAVALALREALARGRPRGVRAACQVHARIPDPAVPCWFYFHATLHV
jgi:hypothetical protein